MTVAPVLCPVALVLSGERGRVGRIGEGRIRAFRAQRACTRHNAICEEHLRGSIALGIKVGKIECDWRVFKKGQSPCSGGTVTSDRRWMLLQQFVQ